MKILILGLDSSILEKNSRLARRAVEYGGLVEKYTVIAPAPKNITMDLSEKVKAYGVIGGHKIIQLLRIYNLAKNILKSERYSIISVQDPYYLAVVGLRLAKKYKLGLELQIHGWEKLNGLRKVAAKFAIKKADSLRAVSQRLKKQLINEFGAKAEKITIAPIYSEFAIRHPARSAGGSSFAIRQDNKFIFLTVGRLVSVKNIGLQIEAMKEVVKRYPDTELWIIGDGLEKKNYELRITNYELEKNIKLLGWKDNFDEYYNMADAFLLTSNYEGWGLAVVEAASFGLPIIMTDVGCAGEIIKNNESGLVIPIGGKQKLVAAMLKIMEDENLKNKLGVKAKLAVSRLPSKEQTLELYKKSWEIAVANGVKLLILTQKVNINDDLLGFMHGWIEEFSKQCEKVTVICLAKGEYHLPENIKVLSLGKEAGESRIKYLINFYRYIWQERRSYNAVFVHMNYEYVILGGLVWKILGKKIGLWYAHGQVSKKLKISEKLANYIFTSTKSGFRLPSKKVYVVGQGIDVDKFKVKSYKLKDKNVILKIVSVGRIAPAKDYMTLIEAARVLRQDNIKFKIDLIGGVSLLKDESYFKELKIKCREYNINNRINFLGAIPNREIMIYLEEAELFVNMGRTGSLDKAIVEAMACELVIITCNEALEEILGEYKNILMYRKGDFMGLARKIKEINNLPAEKIKKIGQDLRLIVIKGHSLNGLINKIINLYETKN